MLLVYPSSTPLSVRTLHMLSNPSLVPLMLSRLLYLSSSMLILTTPKAWPREVFQKRLILLRSPKSNTNSLKLWKNPSISLLSHTPIHMLDTHSYIHMLHLMSLQNVRLNLMLIPTFFTAPTTPE